MSVYSTVHVSDARLCNIFDIKILQEQHFVVDQALNRLSTLASESSDVFTILDKMDVEMKNDKLTERFTCE